MQWLTLRRVTNYVEKHRLLSTDYKSPSNGQLEEKKRSKRSKTSSEAENFFLASTEVLRVNYWFRVSSITTTSRAIAQVHYTAWLIIVVRVLLDNISSRKITDIVHKNVCKNVKLLI